MVVDIVVHSFVNNKQGEIYGPKSRVLAKYTSWLDTTSNIKVRLLTRATNPVKLGGFALNDTHPTNDS